MFNSIVFMAAAAADNVDVDDADAVVDADATQDELGLVGVVPPFDGLVVVELLSRP